MRFLAIAVVFAFLSCAEIPKTVQSPTNPEKPRIPIPKAVLDAFSENQGTLCSYMPTIYEDNVLRTCTSALVMEDGWLMASDAVMPLELKIAKHRDTFRFEKETVLYISMENDQVAFFIDPQGFLPQKVPARLEQSYAAPNQNLWSKISIIGNKDQGQAYPKEYFFRAVLSDPPPQQTYDPDYLFIHIQEAYRLGEITEIPSSKIYGLTFFNENGAVAGILDGFLEGNYGRLIRAENLESFFHTAKKAYMEKLSRGGLDAAEELTLQKAADSLVDMIQNIKKFRHILPPKGIEKCIEELFSRANDQCFDSYEKYFPSHKYEPTSQGVFEKQPTVFLNYPREEIAVLRINTFHAVTPAEIQKTYESVRKSKARSILFDMRNNLGGLLISVLNSLLPWTEENEIVLIEEKKYQSIVYDREKIIEEIQNSNLIDERIISPPLGFGELFCGVLVNEKTASAAEIFAGFLKEKGCHVFGRPTWKKGVTQLILFLPDGAAHSITSSEIFIGKNKKKLNGVGVVPNTRIEEENEARELEKTIEAILKAKS